MLNPLKGDYPYEDIAKDYAGLMIPSRADLLGKLSIESAFTEKQEDALKYVCFEAYTALKSKQALEAELKDTEIMKI